MIRSTLLAVCLLCASPPAPAAAQLTPQYSQQDREILSSSAYLAGHPDLRWRSAALEALDRGDTDAARQHLMRAARYADKASQALLGQMYWKGDGVQRDRALGYVWMDLAAERLYAGYLALRERYWNNMDADERQRALEIGEPIHAEYGDHSTKPRMEAVLRQQRGRHTGSRAGANLGADVYQGNPPGISMYGGTAGMRLRGFHDARYWEPEAYWAWQDEVYQSLRASKVRGLELKPRSERSPMNEAPDR